MKKMTETIKTIEFGEKIKQLREEKGMTQQTMAAQLYVTRQAVSRWECGARYPDLLTAKKISQLLGVSIDELLSGEELRENIEKEPVLAQPVENLLQTILYTIATVAYLLMSAFSLYSLLCPNEALAGTPAGEITLLTITTVLRYLISLAAAGIGLLLSVRNKLTAKITGYIMCIPYLLAALTFLATILEMQIKQNGHMGILGWITDCIIPLGFGICVLAFFTQKERRLPYEIILLLCILSIGYVAYAFQISIHRITDLGFVVRTVHLLGKIGMYLLLGYQARIWHKKRTLAYRSSHT